MSDDIVRDYLDSIGRAPLLTPEEEVALFKAFGSATGPARDEIRERILVANLQLVAYVAKRYKGVSDDERVELMQEGVFGLMRAVEKFDVTRGWKFSTYAVQWIRRMMQGGRVTQHSKGAATGTINLARYRRIVRMARESLASEFGRRPTCAEISEFTGLSQDRILEIDAAGLPPKRLDAPIGEDSAATFLDLIGAPVPDEEEFGLEAFVALHDAISELSDIERRLLVGNIAQGIPLDQLCETFGLNRYYARSIRDTALDRVRAHVLEAIS